MASTDRLLAPLAAVLATVFALVTAWSAEPPSAPVPAPVDPTAAQTAPAGAETPRQRIKPSDPPHLGLFFTDQAVGYIQPCG